MKKGNMIRTLGVLALAAALLLGCAACGRQAAETPAAPEATAAPAPEAAAPESREQGAFAPEGSVIFEKDGVKVTTRGLDVDPTEEPAHPIIWVDVENSGDQDAYLGVAGGSVNGFMTDVLLVTYFDYDEETNAYYGSSYDSSITLPAHTQGRYALGYYRVAAPGVSLDTLEEMEFCFTMAEDANTWPDYSSEPVVIASGESPEKVDIAALGTVVRDDDTLRLVIGSQDYDDWFGPQVCVYAENKSQRFLGLTADLARGDGVECDYIFYGTELAPGKISAAVMSFDGELRELKGFEELSLIFSLRTADSLDGLQSAESTAMESVSVSYPPQIWGEYENGGLRMEIQPKFNDLITVETPENDPRGVIFSVSETASLQAGAHEGAGWLFSIARVDEEKLHELLGSDMSGVEAFAEDGEGGYYLYCHPTDVRYERATPEEMQRDMDQWSMLCQWAAEMTTKLCDQNKLETVSYGNSAVDIAVARAAWQNEGQIALSAGEYGPLPVEGVDGSPYAEFVLRGWFGWSEEEVPEGEYVTLSFPEQEMHLDFFFAPGNFVRVVSGDFESLYQANWYDEDLSFAEAMQGWYYALAEKAGLRTPDESAKAFLGDWHEKIAGRGTLSIAPALAPGKLAIRAEWPESAAVRNTWEMTAVLTGDGKLSYENGRFESIEFDENGDSWQIDGDFALSGEFAINDQGELSWYDSHAEGDGLSVFVR